MQKTQTLRILKAIINALNKENIEWQLIENENGVKLFHRGIHGNNDIIILIDEEKDSICFMCPEVFNFQMDEAKMLKAINHINSNILHGKLIYLEEIQKTSAILSFPIGQAGIEEEIILRGLKTLEAIIDHSVDYLKCLHETIHTGLSEPNLTDFGNGETERERLKA